MLIYGAKVLSMTKKFKKMNLKISTLKPTKIAIALTMKSLGLTAAMAVARILKMSLNMMATIPRHWQ